MGHMNHLHVSRVAAALAPVFAISFALAPVAAQEAVVIRDADGVDVTIDDTSAVATLGGVFTEVAYALGVEEAIVAVDESSFFPPSALSDKNVLGYYRFLSAEPVLSAGPTLIVGNQETGPPEVVSQLRDAGVTMLLLPDGNDVDGARELIATMGELFGRVPEADDVIATLDADVAAAAELVARATSSPRVLFVLQPPEAPMLIAGEVTAAGSMISLAGGANIYPGFPAYIPMTPEGIAEIGPDIILTTDDSLELLGGLDAFMALPGIAQTPAVENGRVVSMDDLYLLGFGPRTGQAIADLARLLHPELTQ
jgi:iron complex transport system substrate-binding protein